MWPELDEQSSALILVGMVDGLDKLHWGFHVQQEVVTQGRALFAACRRHIVRRTDRAAEDHGRRRSTHLCGAGALQREVMDAIRKAPVCVGHQGGVEGRTHLQREEPRLRHSQLGCRSDGGGPPREDVL